VTKSINKRINSFPTFDLQQLLWNTFMELKPNYGSSGSPRTKKHDITELQLQQKA